MQLKRIYKINNVLKIYNIINTISKEKLYTNVLEVNHKTVYVYNFFIKLRLTFKVCLIISKLNINDNTSKIDIIKNINNYMVNNVSFDKNYSSHLDPQNNISYSRKKLISRTAYSALIYNKSACMGYSEALRIFFNYFNINSKTVLVLMPQKPIDKNKYIEKNKSYYYDNISDNNYLLSIYKPILIDDILYKGFAHFSTIVYIDDMKIIVDPDRQRDRERKKISKEAIIYEFKYSMRYLLNIPNNYNPIGDKLLGTDLSNIELVFDESKKITIMEL